LLRLHRGDTSPCELPPPVPQCSAISSSADGDVRCRWWDTAIRDGCVECVCGCERRWTIGSGQRRDAQHMKRGTTTVLLQLQTPPSIPHHPSPPAAVAGASWFEECSKLPAGVSVTTCLISTCGRGLACCLHLHYAAPPPPRPARVSFLHTSDRCIVLLAASRLLWL
jgi:hypothetical protein